MAIAHILKPAPEGGAAQLFLLFCDAGQSWQEMTPLGEALGKAFGSAAIVAPSPTPISAVASGSTFICACQLRMLPMQPGNAASTAPASASSSQAVSSARPSMGVSATPA